MLTPIHLAREEGTSIETGPPPGLDAIDFAILIAFSQTTKLIEVARSVGVSAAIVRTRIARPAMQVAMQKLQAGWWEKLSRGEFGAIALVKANQIGAIRRVLGLARAAVDEKVRLAANKYLIELSGLQAPKPQVIETPDRLIDLMTDEEREHFLATQEFPVRLADQLARVAAPVLRAKRANTVDVEWERVGEDVPEPQVPPEVAEVDRETAPAEETPDSDGDVGWARLPDETEIPDEDMPQVGEEDEKPRRRRR